MKRKKEMMAGRNYGFEEFFYELYKKKLKRVRCWMGAWRKKKKKSWK